MRPAPPRTTFGGSHDDNANFPIDTHPFVLNFFKFFLAPVVNVLEAFLDAEEFDAPRRSPAAVCVCVCVPRVLQVSQETAGIFFFKSLDIVLKGFGWIL